MYSLFIFVASKAGLQQKDVLEVLELTNISSNLMLEKGNGECYENLKYSDSIYVLLSAHFSFYSLIFPLIIINFDSCCFFQSIFFLHPF